MTGGFFKTYNLKPVPEKGSPYPGLAFGYNLDSLITPTPIISLLFPLSVGKKGLRIPSKKCDLTASHARDLESRMRLTVGHASPKVNWSTTFIGMN